MLLVGGEGRPRRKRVHSKAYTLFETLPLEEFDLPTRLEVWGDVDSQSPMGFLKWLLGKFLGWVGWCRCDGECCWMIDYSAILGAVYKPEAAFGNGEGTTRCSMAVVGQLGNVLKVSEVGSW